MTPSCEFYCAFSRTDTLPVFPWNPSKFTFYLIGHDKNMELYCLIMEQMLFKRWRKWFKDIEIGNFIACLQHQLPFPVVIRQVKNATRMKENARYSNVLIKEHLLLNKLDKIIKKFWNGPSFIWLATTIQMFINYCVWYET